MLEDVVGEPLQQTMLPNCPHVDIISFHAPVVSVNRFRLPREDEGSGNYEGTFVYSIDDPTQRVGLILDISPSNMMRFKYSDPPRTAHGTPAGRQLYFVLVSHDFDPLRRAILRTSYRTPTPKGALNARSSKANAHTLNLMVVWDCGAYFERVAPAKMFSEAWPMPEEGEDQKRLVLLA
jgi:hypothetical protein